ncbi:hypothetical protein ACFSQD_14165 [Flavihumibacter stibioxidans]|uniref:Uncharacterized protein n=1 Tax=Flavihumibacter stibioxidans TaxID=1834163 RepID=A0ABR7M8H1_9BACT|nr:hypothetical protein [Flavihumibacter stibioxidans]MBC6491252.1 hypothetical protein [Flavihumibacter stibioxidans]
MAINKNHEFEDLDGIKCAIVERNASKERLDFLKPLLEFNKYTVVAVPTPVKAAPAAAQPAPATAAVQPAPAAPAAPAATAGTAPEAAAIAETGTAPASVPQETTAPPPPPPPATFTIGVTNVMFNPTNAIFGRLLKTPDGHVVTLSYWQQKETISDDEIPYFAKTPCID